MEALFFIAKELKGVVVSVAPLVLILLILKFLVFRSPLENNKQFVIGVVFTILGLFLFLQGAQMSLIPVADSVGSELVKLPRWLIIIAMFAIGFVATLVEPALAATAHEVENVSVGAIRSTFIMGLTAIGFAVGMSLGITKIIYNINFLYILVPALLVLAVLGYFCDQTFAAIAFDCAAATTGPVNIPVNMALALGLARTIEGLDPLTAGFGIIGMTVIGVSTTIMTYGVLRSI